VPLEFLLYLGRYSPGVIPKTTDDPHRLQYFISGCPPCPFSDHVFDVSMRIQDNIVGILNVDRGLIDASGSLREDDGER